MDRGAWPDAVDRSALLLFLLAVVLLPLVGYWLTALDIRRWIWALKGVLVRVTQPSYAVPEWVDQETPPCLRALASLPCSENDVKQAYRRRAELLHPDRGGDIRRFLLLQQQLEQSLHFVRQRGQRDEWGWPGTMRTGHAAFSLIALHWELDGIVSLITLKSAYGRSWVAWEVHSVWVPWNRIARSFALR